MTDASQSDTRKIEGTAFGTRYILQEKIGAGGMGAVYRGHDTVLDKTVAIKQLLPHSQAEAMIRFHQEAKTAARLKHPNILNVLDFGQQESGGLYLIMDFLEGKSLHDLTKKGMAPAEAVPLFIQICKGLSHAHSQGILHRDIKPSNIMVVKDEKGKPQVKIVDFGLAKMEGAEQSLTTTGVRVGSPLYMSPEQAKGLEVDQRSDLYSLGCLMFKTLTGDVPFCGETFIETLEKHANERAADINDIDPEHHQYPRDLAHIVARSLEKDPADRYKTVHDLQRSLEEVELNVAPPMVLSQEDLSESKNTSVKVSAKALRSMPLPMKVAAALTGLLLIGSIFMLVSNWNVITKADAAGSSQSKVRKLQMRMIAGEEWLKADSEFTDRDMRLLQNYKNVSNLCLQLTLVTGNSGFDVLPQMSVRKLRLNDNSHLTDEAMKPISKMKNLAELWLTNTLVTDEGIEQLQGLSTLEALKVDDTGITDRALACLAKLPRLRQVDISDCASITDEGIELLTKSKSLKFIDIKHCEKVSKAAIDAFKASGRERDAVYDKEDFDLKKAQSERPHREHHGCLETMAELSRDIKADPEFKKFFLDKKNWDRTSFADVKNPRILKWVNNPKMRAQMRRPEIRAKYTKEAYWKELEEDADILADPTALLGL